MKNRKYYINKTATIILNKVYVSAFSPTTPRMMKQSQMQMNMGNKVRKKFRISFLNPIILSIDFMMIMRDK
jgi:hypothetical protein